MAADPQKALALFKAGLDYPAIADQLGTLDGATYTPDDIRTVVAAAIAGSRVALDQAAARIVQLEQIDTMHRSIWPKAIGGDLAAIDRVVKLQAERERLLGEPTRVKDALTESFDASVAALDLKTEDGTLVAAGRQVARQIDHAVAHGTSLEATKALYLLPHLMNVLRELGATPAARAALQNSLPPRDPDGDDDTDKGAPVDLADFKRSHGGRAR